MPFWRSTFTFRARVSSTSGQAVAVDDPAQPPRSSGLIRRTADADTAAASDPTAANSPRRSVAASFPAAMLALMLVCTWSAVPVFARARARPPKTPSFARLDAAISHPDGLRPATPDLQRLPSQWPSLEHRAVSADRT